MKLIIAGSRTFTDYQKLCQVLAPDRHLHHAGHHGRDPGRRPARLPLGVEARRAPSTFPGELGAVRQVRRRAAQSPDGPGRRRPRRVLGRAIARHIAHDPVHARPGQTRGGRQRRYRRSEEGGEAGRGAGYIYEKNESWARMSSSHPRASEPREGSTARRINPLDTKGGPMATPYHIVSPPCNTPSRISPAMNMPTPCVGSRRACTRHSSSRARRAAMPTPTRPAGAGPRPGTTRRRDPRRGSRRSQRRGRERHRPLHRPPGAARLSMPGLAAAHGPLRAPAGGGDAHRRTWFLRGLCAAHPAGHHPASHHHQPAGGARSDRLWAATCASHPHRAHAAWPGPSPDRDTPPAGPPAKRQRA